MKSRFLFIEMALVFIVILHASACDTNNTNSHITDSTQVGSADSMPVLQMPITDSSGIITTPPVNDDNVIMPDTSTGRR